jgi:hypothetical protein
VLHRFRISYERINPETFVGLLGLWIDHLKASTHDRDHVSGPSVQCAFVYFVILILYQNISVNCNIAKDRASHNTDCEEFCLLKCNAEKNSASCWFLVWPTLNPKDGGDKFLRNVE